MKEQVHEIDSKAYIIMSEVADIFSNNMDKALRKGGELNFLHLLCP